MMAAIGRARALPLPQVRLDRRGRHGSVFADRTLAAAGRHARAPAAQRGGRLLEGAAQDPGQEEGHLERGPPLLHVASALGSRGSPGTAKDRELLGLRLLAELAGRRGRRPAGWLPALADTGVDFSGLPTDRPVGFDDIEAFELRNAGRVEVFVFVWRAGVLPRPPAARPERHGRCPAHRAASPAQRPLQPQLPGAGHQAGADPAATPTNTGGCMEYKCPRCVARFAKKASWQRHRAAQCYREIAERTRKVPLPGVDRFERFLPRKRSGDKDR